MGIRCGFLNYLFWYGYGYVNQYKKVVIILIYFNLIHCNIIAFNEKQLHVLFNNHIMLVVIDADAVYRTSR